MPVGAFVPSRIHLDYPEWQAPLIGNVGQVWAYDGTGYVPTSFLLASAVSAYGLTLIDDADAATARTTLGLGTMATETATAYLLADGSRAGATISAQTLANGVITGKIYPSANGTNAFGLYRANGTTQDFYYDSTNGYFGIGIVPVRALHLNGSLRIDATAMIFDNRNNTIIAQSASAIASNRDLYIGNTTYAYAALGFKGVGFGPGIVTADIGTATAVFLVRGGASTGTFGQNIVLLGQDGAAGNNNGGHIIIDPGAATGSGTVGVIRLGAIRGNVAVGQASATALLDLAASTTARASLRVRAGTAPTAPNAGDVWFDGTHFYGYTGSATVQLDN